MTTLKIDPNTYYTAAKKLILLADQAVLPFIALHNNLHDNGGMAGNYQGVEAWTAPYDTQAQDFHTAYIAYLNALNHFGDILNATGYNWDSGNYNADKNPHKGDPPATPATSTEPLVKTSLPTPPSAKSANTAPGLDEGPLHGLLAKITHPVPNGDLGKLATIHSTWDSFAKHNAVTSAQSTIKQLIDTFTDQGTVDPHLPRIQEYLTNLSTAAGNLAQASTAITTTVANHHDQLSTLRDNIQRDRTGALIAVGATVITAGLLWCLTVVATDGAGAAATGVEVDAAAAATEAEIATAAAAITSDITASTFPALLADGAEIFSGIGQFTKADAQILAIQALIVAMVSGDSAKDGGDQPASAHPNDAVTKKMAEMLRKGIHKNTDCSEIAEDLEEAADGEGNILRVEPPKGKLLDVEEDGLREKYDYHEVYSDENYVYDPRLSRDPIPKAEWEKEILKDNPGAKIRTTK